MLCDVCFVPFIARPWYSRMYEYEYMNELYNDEPTEWTTRVLRQINTAGPVGRGRKLRQYVHYIPE